MGPKGRGRVQKVRIHKSRKDFEVVKVRNEETGRLNRVYRCLLCRRTFKKICNAKYHSGAH